MSYQLLYLLSIISHRNIHNLSESIFYSHLIFVSKLIPDKLEETKEIFWAINLKFEIKRYLCVEGRATAIHNTPFNATHE